MAIITDGQAKRLARQFGLTGLRESGRILLPEDVLTVDALATPASTRDPQGWAADRRALIDYLRVCGPRTVVADWDRLAESTEVVPWSYGR